LIPIQGFGFCGSPPAARNISHCHGTADSGNNCWKFLGAVEIAYPERDKSCRWNSEYGTGDDCP